MNEPIDNTDAHRRPAKPDHGDDTLASSEIVQFIVESYKFVSDVVGGTFNAARRFLERGRPASIFLAAFLLYLAAVLLVQMIPIWFHDAIRAQESGRFREFEGALRTMQFLSFTEAMARITAIMLGAWALVRLIADAIKSGNTNA